MDKRRNRKKIRFTRLTFLNEPRALSGMECRVNQFQKTLSAEERASFLSALYDPTIVLSSLCRVVRRYGYLGAVTTLYGHRQNPGTCQRCKQANQERQKGRR